MGKKFNKHQHHLSQEEEKKETKQEEKSFGNKFQQKEMTLPKRSVEEEKKNKLEVVYRTEWLVDQISCLQKLFPGLDVNQELFKQLKHGSKPIENSEYCLVPNIWGEGQKVFGQTYKEAVEKLFSAINKVVDGKFKYNKGVIDRIQLSSGTEKFFRGLSEAQDNPGILIIPTQFVICHEKCNAEALVVGSMILTHPSFLMDNYHDDVCIYLNGCASVSDTDGAKMMPFFRIDSGEVGFGLSSMKDINGEGKCTHVCSNPFTVNVSLSLFSLQ